MTMNIEEKVAQAIPRAGIFDTAALLIDVVLPTIAKGIFVRRPTSVALVSRLGLDQRAVRRLQKIRAKHGDVNLLLAIPGRYQALVLTPEDVRTILAGAPEPFAPATLEKRSALAHFEPNISLISRGPERERRRRLSDEALESNARAHSHAIAFAKILDDEAEALLGVTADQLDWRSFESCWRRALRQIVFGMAARDDQEMTEQLEQLRAAANWAFLRPKKTALLAEFQKRVSERIAAAPPDSLAGRIKGRGYGEADAPADQVAHWLFASDAAAIGAFRALALIAGHSEARELARQEARGQTGSAVYPFIRAAMRESLRLWPTAPTLFRETTTQTGCGDWSLPPHTHLFIFLPYFHRDDTRLPFANRFAPELWLDGRSGDSLTLIPFSAGPAKCPAHQLAPLLGSCMLASLLRRADFKQATPLQLDGRAPMPPTLNHFRLRFEVARA